MHDVAEAVKAAVVGKSIFRFSYCGGDAEAESRFGIDFYFNAAFHLRPDTVL